MDSAASNGVVDRDDLDLPSEVIYLIVLALNITIKPNRIEFPELRTVTVVYGYKYSVKLINVG